MERLLQTFEAPFADHDGNLYAVQLFGRSRPGDTWQAMLTFVRQRDGISFTTGVETTQSNAEAVLYWATGLTPAYFDGAFERARLQSTQSTRPSAAPIEAAPPLRDVTADRETYLHRLNELETQVLDSFRRHGADRVATQTVLDELPHAHADVVRAIEDLEKQRHLVERVTDGGTDWLIRRR
ncbi:MAG TPA: hypothetical protein VF824_22495 [Thermoanaerobaculia bacterium]|jgi:hypothetical protein